MNVLPFVTALPHILAAVRPDDGQMAVLAVLSGMGVSLRLSSRRQQARIRREQFIRDRKSQHDVRQYRDNDPR